MFRRIGLAVLGLGFIAGGSNLWADFVSIGTLTVDSLSSTGTSFTYSGTLTQNDTFDLTVSGVPCLQPGPPPAYCVNAAGVVLVPGTSAVGEATTFDGPIGGTTNMWNFGSLLMEIGPYTVQLFPADTANGLGSATPPSSLTLPVSTFHDLNFPDFSLVDPTITFVLADNLYTDNSGQFSLSQQVPGVPEPTYVGFIGVTLGLLAGIARRLRIARNSR